MHLYRRYWKYNSREIGFKENRGDIFYPADISDDPANYSNIYLIGVIRIQSRFNSSHFTTMVDFLKIYIILNPYFVFYATFNKYKISNTN